ncbi:MOSC domain-containing protein [Amycolatopsis sp. CA-161197]|uniref:MOSC domain-containing protein n=1 Tax=Amycolatopsis sp. CA-161197 TaxID=3239922 RepID=UPI003D950ADD
MPTLVSVNVGMPKDVEWNGRIVHTGIWKGAVSGPRMVRRLNVDGDGQGDPAGHGGEQRAVFVYQLESIEYWQAYFGHDSYEFGQFGENFTVTGMPDDEVCVGDRYRIGEAEFEVTQPRVTCFRVGMRLNEPELPSLLVSHGRPGFYFRVLREGHVAAGDEIVRTRRGPHEMTVADVDALLYTPNRTTEALESAVDIPALSPGWRQSFRELLSPAEKPADPGWTGFRPLTVTKVVRESATITSVHLDAPGEALPAARPGQYLTVRLPGAGEPPLIRSYSLSTTEGYRISVKRDGAASTYVHDVLKAGDTLDAAAPRGDFVLEPGSGPVVLLSAGVGVTPVLAMLHQLAAEEPERAIWWIQTARNAADQAFELEVRGLLARLPNSHAHFFHTRPESGADSRRVTGRTLKELALPAGATAYVCGPPSFMDDVREALVALGCTDVRTELFGALAAINPGVREAGTVAPHPPEGPPGTGPAVTFARSGLTVRWRDDGETLLELAEACAVPTRWACRSGVCHTCDTPLLAGATTYDPAPLELPPAGRILVCCARPETDVVLDQ